MTTENHSSTNQNQVDNFLLTTTFHGLHKVAPSRSNPSRRYAWLCIVFLHVLGFSGHMGWLVSRYFSYPVITKQNEGVIPASFPDVTICFNAPFRGSKVNTLIPNLGNKTFTAAESNANLFWSGVLRGQLPNLDEKSKKNILNRLQANSMMPHAIVHDITQDVAGQMLACWLNEFQNCPTMEVFTRFSHPRKGSCITYESSDSILVNNRTFKDKVVKLDLLFGQIPDDLSYGFDYSQSFSTFVKGATLIFHAPGTYPIGIEHVSNIATGTTVEVKMTSIVQNDSPLNPCVSHEKILEVWLPHHQATHKYAYNSILCRQLELQRKMKSTCQCVSEELPLPNEDSFKKDITLCHSLKEDILSGESLKMVNDTLFIQTGKAKEFQKVDEYMKTSVNVKNMLCHEKIMTIRISDDQCPVTCSRTEYRSSSFYESKPFVFHATINLIPQLVNQKIEELKALNKSTDTLQQMVKPDFFGKKFQRIRVRLSSLMGDLMTQKSAYSVGNLFSDIGGIFGLWIGCSIITLLELSEFSVSVTQAKRKIRIEQVSMNKSEKNSAMTLEATNAKPEDKTQEIQEQIA